jgi:hypothetical protein
MSPTFTTAVRTSILLCLSVLAACDTVPIDVPPPATPQLESVNLVGQRVCGAFTNSNTLFNFTCAPLPTSIDTGWLIEPLRKPHPTNPNWTVINRGIVFTVSTPPLTSIEISYQASGGARYVRAQVSPGPGRPAILSTGFPREVEVAAADDGVRKTWTIGVATESCLEKMTIEVVNTSRGVRSDRLPIYVLRNPSETYCAPYGPTASGPQSPDIYLPRTGGAGPTGSGSSGPCGGAPRAFFEFCERCGQNPASTHYTGIESCSLTDARATMGYGPGAPPRQCTLSQVSGPAQCKGP